MLVDEVTQADLAEVVQADPPTQDHQVYADVGDTPPQSPANHLPGNFCIILRRNTLSARKETTELDGLF